MDNRYQFQTRPVKVLRWLRHMPVSWFTSALESIIWLLDGAREFDYGNGHKLTKLQSLQTIWSMNRSKAECAMGWYWTTSELLEKLRLRQSKG